MKLTEKIAYMKGLLAGMELDNSTKESKAILQMAEVMEEMGVYIDDLQSQVDELTELCDLLDKDLGEVEYDLYCDEDDEDEEYDDEEDDDTPYRRILAKGSEPDFLTHPFDAEYDDEDDDDEEYDENVYLVKCPSCDEIVNLSEHQLEEGSIICPHCAELLEFDYDTIETDDGEEDESSDDGKDES